jgi:hypothetical protein
MEVVLEKENINTMDSKGDVSTINKIQFHISNIAENRSISAV